jgi:hypothetical protein
MLSVSVSLTIMHRRRVDPSGPFPYSNGIGILIVSLISGDTVSRWSSSGAQKTPLPGHAPLLPWLNVQPSRRRYFVARQRDVIDPRGQATDHALQ